MKPPPAPILGPVPLLALLGVAGSWAAGFAAWSLLGEPVAAHDDANLLLWAVDLQDWLATGAPLPVPPNRRGAPYPPLVPLLAAAHFALVGARSAGLAVASAWPFVGLLSAVTGLSLRGRLPPVGLLAAAGVAPLPLWSLGHPGSFHLEIPVACATAAAVLAGARASEGGGAPWVWTAALCGALALLTKWTAILFLLPAFLLALGRAGQKGRRAALLAGLGGLLVAFPWYIDNISPLWTFLTRNLAGEYQGEGASLGDAAAFYPSRLFTGVLGTPLLACLAAGAWTARRRSWPALLALSSLAAGLALLTLQPYRDQRYLLGGLGLLGPALALGAHRLGGRPALLLMLGIGLCWPWRGGALPPAALPPALTPGLVVDRDGLRRAGLLRARAELQRPRWRLSWAPPAPAAPSPPLRLAAGALHRLAPPDRPLVVHLVDRVGRSAMERSRVELALRRGASVQISRPAAREADLSRRLAEGRVADWSPPPALADRAYVLESLPLADLAALRPAWAALAAEGRPLLYRGGSGVGERAALIQIWGPPGSKAGAKPPR